MNEFLIFIKSIGNTILGLSEGKQNKYIEKVGGFIQDFKVENGNKTNYENWRYK